MSLHEIETRWDGIIWLGDFNSRIEGFRHDDDMIMGAGNPVMQAMEQGKYEHLLPHDQLTYDLFVARNPVLGAPCPFKEGHFETFAPTFKIKPGTEDLPETNPELYIAKAINVYGTKRLPAWTDRILYFSVGMCTDNEYSRPKTMVQTNFGK